jgi:hypothetical protein
MLTPPANGVLDTVFYTSGGYRNDGATNQPSTFGLDLLQLKAQCVERRARRLVIISHRQLLEAEKCFDG